MLRLMLVLFSAVLWIGCHRPTPNRSSRRPPPPAPVEVVPVIEPAPELAYLNQGLEAYVDAFSPEGYEICRSGDYQYYIDPVKDAIKDVIRHNQVWEPHVQEYLKAFIKPGDIVLDIGAHIGTHTTLMSDLVGEGGQVYAYEPQREMYRELVQNLRLNKSDRVTALRVALGENPGVVEMNPTVEGNQGGTGVGKDGDKVELRTLDSYRFPKLDLVKIDVEGFEPYVLKGAGESLTRTKPIILIEIMGGSDYAEASPEIRRMIEQTRGLLAALGYRSRQLWHHDYLALPFEPGPDRKWIDVGEPGTRSYLRSQFHANEFDTVFKASYAWSEGNLCSVTVPLEKVSKEPYVLGLRARGFEPIIPIKTQLLVNGAEAGEISLSSQWGAFELLLDSKLLKVGENVVEFRLERSASPKEYKLNLADERHLGMSLDLVWLTPDALGPDF